MNVDPRALLLQPGDGELLTFVGISTRIKVPSEATNGAWTLIESTVAAHFPGFKLHLHRRMTETFYILQGSLLLHIGDDKVRANAGALLVVPPGVMHTYSNPTDAETKYLLFMTPGGFDEYLKQLAELIRRAPQWPPADPSELNALAERYDATPG